MHFADIELIYLKYNRHEYNEFFYLVLLLIYILEILFVNELHTGKYLWIEMYIEYPMHISFIVS